MTDRLAAWLEELDRQPLPIPASHYAGLHAALSDSRRSLREIADQLQGSPTLALSILREANRAESARDNPAESLEVALSRLGLARASQLLKTLPSIQDAEMPRVLGQMLLISQHAMQQASGLFGARLARLWQEIHWGSLLTMAPVWALANARPQLLEQWQQRVLVQGEPTLRVERELLGIACCRSAWRWPNAGGYRSGSSRAIACSPATVVCWFEPCVSPATISRPCSSNSNSMPSPISPAG